MSYQSLCGQWQLRKVGTEEWLPAEVPGGVHTDLMALGRIPDPFVADHELEVQWVAESDWEYRCFFDAKPDLLAEDKIYLVCDGLDTLATVSLNGVSLGSTDNMFRCYSWEVKSLISNGKNELQVTFTSAVRYASSRQAEQYQQAPDQSIPGAPYLRKAPCQFGWDWGPQLPPVGIWKSIHLQGYSHARFDEIHVTQDHTNDHSSAGARGEVSIAVQVTVERWDNADARVIANLAAPDGGVQDEECVLPGDTGSAVVSINVADPQIWWPNDYGKQPLYQVDVVLLTGDTVLDRRTFKIGLRTIELRQEPDEYGTSFTFVVNGVPIFAKGANWIPADSFPTRISDSYLENLVRSAADVHMNMLRVWGGGFYEGERFYDLCDRYGILVWQDFAFSCSTYPDDESFFENVRLEAVETVRRLRHRASLALWCGNNEMEWGWIEWGWHDRFDLSVKAAYDRMFHHLLPEVVTAEDPTRPYWPSSPSSGIPFDDPNNVQSGDTHNWEVWHGMLPFAGYRQHNSRFMSEFGFQSLPSIKTISTYADEEDWNLTSYIMEHHQRNAAGNGKIITYLSDHFRMPKNFESLVYLSQLLQAEAVRNGVEYWRRNRACTSGALYWQLNDCWPVASWASLDYYGRWKALHYAARRFFAPVLLSAEESGTSVRLEVTSDLLSDWSGIVRWSLETVGGEVLQAGEEAVDVAALSSLRVCDLDFSGVVFGAGCRDVIFVYELWQAAKRVSMGVVSFIASKHLKLEDPCIELNVTGSDQGCTVKLEARSLARFVRLDLAGTDVVFSDNYFDLPAGRSLSVTTPPIPGWDAEGVKSALTVCSLIDSF
ncbi:MAG: glycoside hydrolase family 2 protein [Anaerolineae bacterium]|nr:glycoside hydrolase family 2 protein [Anaerolineae bacterium]